MVRRTSGRHALGSQGHLLSTRNFQQVEASYPHSYRLCLEDFRSWSETRSRANIGVIDGGNSKPLRLIETQSSARRSASPTPFQNHYGWIETSVVSILKAVKIMFQNHYGWIETDSSAAIADKPERGFKTTTVGLRPTSALKILSQAEKFQNHYGWIETLLRSLLTDMDYCFKTTTVGLRLEMLKANDYNPNGFKTTTVGLRPRRHLPGAGRPNGFKTTTVGLRLPPPVWFMRIVLPFQNHYGWIETV